MYKYNATISLLYILGGDHLAPPMINIGNIVYLTHYKINTIYLETKTLLSKGEDKGETIFWVGWEFMFRQEN